MTSFWLSRRTKKIHINYMIKWIRKEWCSGKQTLEYARDSAVQKNHHSVSYLTISIFSGGTKSSELRFSAEIAIEFKTMTWRHLRWKIAGRSLTKESSVLTWHVFIKKYEISSLTIWNVRFVPPSQSFKVIHGIFNRQPFFRNKIFSRQFHEIVFGAGALLRFSFASFC